MKVAIIIAGHLRSWKQMFPYFKANFIDRYNNPDIFISTWNDEGWWKWGNEKGIYENSDAVNFDEVLEAYKPKDLKHDNYDLYDAHFKERADKFTNKIGWPKNVISMTYRWMDACRILDFYAKSNNIHYDLVIRTRTDLEVLGELPEFDPSNFYIIHNDYHQGGLNDVIHAGNMNDIFKVNTMYSQLETLYERIGTFCPHLFAQEIVKTNNIQLISLPLPYRIMNTPWGQHQDVHRFIDNK
jgi:hypothetical protein